MPLLRLAASRGAGLGSFSPLGRDHSAESGHWFEAQTLDSLSSRETGQGQGLSAVGTTQPAPGEGTEGPGQTWGHHKTHSLYPPSHPGVTHYTGCRTTLLPKSGSRVQAALETPTAWGLAAWILRTGYTSKYAKYLTA